MIQLRQGDVRAYWRFSRKDRVTRTNGARHPRCLKNLRVLSFRQPTHHTPPNRRLRSGVGVGRIDLSRGP